MMLYAYGWRIDVPELRIVSKVVFVSVIVAVVAIMLFNFYVILTSLYT